MVTTLQSFEGHKALFFCMINMNELPIMGFISACFIISNIKHTIAIYFYFQQAYYSDHCRKTRPIQQRTPLLF